MRDLYIEQERFVSIKQKRIAAGRSINDYSFAHIETLSGQPRRRARSKFNKRWGEYAYELRQISRKEEE